MSLLTRSASLFRLLLRKSKTESDLDSELFSHFTLLVDRYREQGLSEEAARRAAHMEFEGIEQTKEKVREVRVGATIESIFANIRYGCRALAKSPAFTVTALLALALGIGAKPRSSAL